MANSARKVTVKMAHAIAQNISGLDRLKIDIDYFLSDVRNEVSALFQSRDVDPLWHRQRALLFALASPQSKFDNNVIAARRLHKGLQNFKTVEDVYEALTADKTGTLTSGNVARAIFHSLPVLRNPPDYNAWDLRQMARDRFIMGAGRKVTAFAAHLYDPNDAAFTLDTHMLRGIIDTTLGIVDTWTIGDSAYEIIENALIDWAFSRYPAETIFTVQWAMWSVFRGSFDSHMAIFK